MRNLFNHTFTHRRYVESQNEYGEVVYTWVDLAPIMGRLRVATVAEKTVAQTLYPDLAYVFYCGPGEDVRRGDRIVLGTTVVEIIGVNDPSFTGHHLECMGKNVV